MAYSIKNYSSASSAANVLNGTAGSLAALLRACLVTGYGSKAVQTLVISGGIATATYATAHPYLARQVLRVVGAGLAAANGEQTVLTASANAVTFAVPGAPDGAVSGAAITTDVAPAGWTEWYPGTANVVVLRPSVPEATGCPLRMDDTGTNNGRLVGYEAMADAANGSGPFPTSLQLAGGLYWGKSNAADATARAWRLIADERGFHFWSAPHASYQTHGVLRWFGDLNPDKPGDPYACMITGETSNLVTTVSTVNSCLGVSGATDTSGGLYLPRSYTGLGGSVVARKTAAYGTGVSYSGHSSYLAGGFVLPCPNRADQSLRFTSLDITVAPDGFRGVTPGLCHTPLTVLETFQTGDIVPGTGAYAGRNYMAIRTGPPGNSVGTAGCVFIQIDGSWRT